MYDRGIGVHADHAWSGRFRAGPGVRRPGESPRPLPHHLRGRRDRPARAGWKGCRSCRSCAARSRSCTKRSSPRSPTTPPTSPSGRYARPATSTCGGSTTRHPGRVLANVDDGPTKDVMLRFGWADVDPPGRGALRPLARSRRGHQPDRRPAPRRRPLRSERAAARLDGPDRRPAPRRSGAARRGHLLQHGRSAFTERPDDAPDHPQPDPHPQGALQRPPRPGHGTSQLIGSRPVVMGAAPDSRRTASDAQSSNVTTPRTFRPSRMS